LFLKRHDNRRTVFYDGFARPYCSLFTDPTVSALSGRRTVPLRAGFRYLGIRATAVSLYYAFTPSGCLPHLVLLRPFKRMYTFRGLVDPYCSPSYERSGGQKCRQILWTGIGKRGSVMGRRRRRVNVLTNAAHPAETADRLPQNGL
jgi:hypothetical protein